MRPLFVAGTRPEVIKLWPVYLKFKEKGFSPIWIHSGQHDAMALPLYEALGIEPDLAIELPSRGSDLATLGSLLLLRLGEALQDIDPSVVIVQGDTHTVLYASLAAFYQQIPIAHVEAGLRTGNLASPFPEEANRQMVARISTYHFCPTVRSQLNLFNEDIPTSSVYRVGNTIVDAVKLVTSTCAIAETGHILVTLHRRENQDELSHILMAIRYLAEKYNHRIIFPVHMSPRVKDLVYQQLGAIENVNLIEPVLYPEFIRLVYGANVIITDSGGIQEEAVTLGVPLVICRDTTERPEAVECGIGILAGRDPAHISRHAHDAFYKGTIDVEDNPFGDGNASERIVKVLVNGPEAT
jgi:UDP-N-acetylglucosamine 2-epimerase (non-hydrolysing)